MVRSSLPLLLSGVLATSAGCSHMAESRVVSAFAESLKEHDLNRLKAESSEDFESRAIHGETTFAALKMVELPEGKQKVVKVKEKNGEKQVLVEVGDSKSKKKLLYRLKRDADSGKWVVDDFFLSKGDYADNKSVGGRLALLISTREFLDAWEAGKRDRILAAATPEFAQALSELPPEYLAQFAKKVTADVAEQTRVADTARYGDETAEMKLPKLGGEIGLTFRKSGDRWRVDDVSVESRRNGDAIGSVRKVAAATAAAMTFQNAYRASDKRMLHDVCTPRFFDGSLAAANLAAVRLPAPAEGQTQFDVKLEGGAATFIIPSDRDVLKLSLVQQAQTEKLHAPPKYLVDEATIYELNSAQDKRLSALFTGHAAMEAFAAAMVKRDLKTVRELSSLDFNERVWKHVKETTVAQLPASEFKAVRPRIVQTSFKGSLTEVFVEQGDTPLTYVLREEGGRMKVDDILIPVTRDWLDAPEQAVANRRAVRIDERPESLKLTYEILLPVIDFGIGLDEGAMDVVRGSSTEEFSKFTWNHLSAPPDFDFPPQKFLRNRVQRIRISGDRAEVAFGDDRQGAMVKLLKERGRYRIDDMTLVAGPQADQRIELKRAIRTQLAQGR